MLELDMGCGLLDVSNAPITTEFCLAAKFRDVMAQHRTGLGDAWVDKSAAIPNHGSFGLLNPDDQVGNIVTGKTRIDVTANNFNVVANPSVHALRQQIDHSCSLEAAFNMHKAANIR